MDNKRVILHIDMNNFYATVECMLNPELRDKAIVVGGSVKERRGIVLAKNYRAKAYGIKTGETIWQAERKCKDVVVVPPNYEHYIKFSKLAQDIYARYTDKIEPYGIDECWLDVTGSKIFGTGEEIAEEIKKTIKFELGLTVSIGVSYNKIFAKLGSDMKKPDAITCIYEHDFKQKVWPLPVEDLLGVGSATYKKLRLGNVLTIGDLAHTSDELLETVFGINGLKLKQYANGYDRSVVKPYQYKIPIKSIGHGTTTRKDLRNNDEVWRVVLSLVQDIGAKLKKYNKRAGGVSISIKNNDLCTVQYQCQLPSPTQISYLLAKTAFDLFTKQYEWEHHIRQVTVRAINLKDENIPLVYDLFTDITHVKKQEKLDVAIETLRERFGKPIIRNAVLLTDHKLPNKPDIELTMPTGMLS